MANIQMVWPRIQAHAGDTVRQIRGGSFRYTIVDDHVVLDRTNQRVPRSQFAEALQIVPLPNTVPLQHLRAQSYIYAILMDPRVRRSDW